jgi:hypothetical protein
MKEYYTLNRRIKETATRLEVLVCEKNASYGNSVEVSAVIMEELYPEGIPTAKYRDALLVLRIIDKLCRIANAKEAFKENPFLDIAGYGVRGSIANE